MKSAKPFNAIRCIKSVDLTTTSSSSSSSIRCDYNTQLLSNVIKNKKIGCCYFYIKHNILRLIYINNYYLYLAVQETCASFLLASCTLTATAATWKRSDQIKLLSVQRESPSWSVGERDISVLWQRLLYEHVAKIWQDLIGRL
jgi:hypothetical protein